MEKTMSKKTQEMRCNAMKLLSTQFRRDINSVRLNTHNTIFHELAKCKKVYELMSDGYEVYTEVYMKGGGIADIFVPEQFRIIEILHSETNERLAKKIKKYPEEFEIISFTSKEILVD